MVASALDVNMLPPNMTAADEPAFEATLGLHRSPPSLLPLLASEAAGVPPNTAPPKAAVLKAPLPKVEVPPKANPLAPLLARPPKPPPENGAAEAAGSGSLEGATDT
jgi:hypothetical protein